MRKLLLAHLKTINADSMPPAVIDMIEAKLASELEGLMKKKVTPQLVADTVLEFMKGPAQPSAPASTTASAAGSR